MFNGKRILLVDDDARVLFVLHAALRRLGDGLYIATVTQGHQALKLIQQDHFDLLISDLRLPGLDGIALTEAVRKLAHDPVVIWITAHGCHEVNAAAARLNVYRCLDKPLEISEIREVTREALRVASRT